MGYGSDYIKRVVKLVERILDMELQVDCFVMFVVVYLYDMIDDKVVKDENEVK